MKRRIATEWLTKIYIARCGYTWLDESNWPQEWPISPITIVYLKIPGEKMKSFCLHKTGFLNEGRSCLPSELKSIVCICFDAIRRIQQTLYVT